jgi:hypothetical protein
MYLSQLLKVNQFLFVSYILPNMPILGLKNGLLKPNFNSSRQHSDL